MKSLILIIFILLSPSASVWAYQFIDEAPEDSILEPYTVNVSIPLLDPEQFCKDCHYYKEGVQEDLLRYHSTMIFDDEDERQSKSTE